MATAKKSYVLAMALLLAVVTVLSGCGSSKENESAEGGSSEKPVELIWYTIGTPQKDVDTVMAEVSKYTSEKIGATVKMNMLDWGDYDQKMKVMTASGTDMDIMFTASWAFDYVQNARKGAFLEIDGLLTEYGQGIVDALDPAFMEGTKVDGHNYGIPANKELPALDVWRFNKSLLDKYNLDITGVSSLESLEPLLKTIKENEPGVTAFALDKTHQPYLPYTYVIQNLPMAVPLNTTDYKIVNLLEQPDLTAALTTMHKYYEAGFISAEAASTTSTNDLQQSGKWFMDRVSSQPMADNLWSASYGYPVVSVNASEAIIDNWSVMGSMQAISANSAHPEKAMEFLNLLNTDAYLRNLIDSGIEGVHYEKVNETTIKNLDESKNYDMPTFSLGNLFLTYLNEGDQADKWEQFKAYNAAGKASPLLGFNFDTSAVTSEIAAVQNVKEEYWAALMTGTVDPAAYLPKAIEKFKEAGLDKVIAEAQRQLDEWRAANK